MTAICDEKFERFVPQGNASLAEDAPGWGKGEEVQTGPLCWKCRGSGVTKRKKKKASGDETATSSECSVCQGRGRLPPRRAEMAAASNPGLITRGRRRPKGWEPSGPLPYALTDSESGEWAAHIERANKGEDVSLGNETANKPGTPAWLPRQGEELCNLVGSWRILQKAASHRWTTDDLVTAYVAYREISSTLSTGQTIQYLDLGCGNASVLQMTTWALLRDQHLIQATGIEARLEAVELARRSLSFNIGSSESAARVVHGDFRDVSLDNQFDLITGTPPYFRVDFVVNDKEQLVTKAVIQQGGMPTAQQSAPARCEFRGGIEAYCEAASRVIKPDCGYFVVCENWLNHDRVVKAAADSGLSILKVVRVKGRQSRNTPLFCVYVMKRYKIRQREKLEAKEETLTVRENDGTWNCQYADTILQTMSIPAPTD